MIWRFSSTTRISSSPSRELAHAVGLQRPGHADLEQAQADLGGERGVDAEVVERLAHVEVGLAAGDDAQPRPRAVVDVRFSLLARA
jgi:type II secretory pathway component PulM